MRKIEQTIAVLEDAEALVTQGWVRKAERSYDYRNHHDTYCVLGAVRASAATHRTEPDRAYWRMQAAIGLVPVVIWNDLAPWRRQRQVVRRFRFAIRLAKLQARITKPGFTAAWWEQHWLDAAKKLDTPYPALDLGAIPQLQHQYHQAVKPPTASKVVSREQARGRAPQSTYR